MSPVGAIAIVLDGVLASVAIGNAFLMPRPGRRPGEPITVAIPCRNEAHHIGRLVEALKADDPTTTVIVFDDESTDSTAEIARQAGATVVAPSEPLPAGWTGKNRACDALAQHVETEWFVFLDADTYPRSGFADAIRDLIARRSPDVELITGFPRILSGRGVEPLFLFWVGWALLATNPFGLVYRTRRGHNRFSNGQFQVWRTRAYLDLSPHAAVRDRILEDVLIGRMLAKRGAPVTVANVSDVLAVRMYETWRETLDGMSKNSHEVAGSTAGSIALPALFLFVAWSWVAFPPALVLLVASGAAVELAVRRVPWASLFAPLGITLGAYTILRSLVWRRKGRIAWKGRVYPNKKRRPPDY